MRCTWLPAVVLAAACGRAEPPAAGWQTFGAEISDGTPIPAAKLMAEPDRYDGQTLLVEGEVDAVCKVKGCWLTLRDGDRHIRVKFKDYAFFVPKDCEHRTVRVEGVFDVRTVPEAEAKHYLEDQGLHDEAEKLEGDQKELTFVASGVRLKP